MNWQLQLIAYIVPLLCISVLYVAHIPVFIAACMSDLQFYSVAHLPHGRTLRYTSHLPNAAAGPIAGVDGLQFYRCKIRV